MRIGSVSIPSHLADSARAANAAAAIAVEGEKTINPALSADAVQQRMQEQEERI